MKKLSLFLSLLLAIGLFGGCSNDDEKHLIDNCYTGVVKYVGSEMGSVQTVIVAIPDGGEIPVGSEVFFYSKDLSGSMPKIDDIIQFSIIEYTQIRETDGPGLVLKFSCKVKICK